MATHNGHLRTATVLVIAGSLLGIVGVSSDTKPRPRYPDVDIGADSLRGAKASADRD